jgi:hypothetical protein
MAAKFALLEILLSDSLVADPAALDRRLLTHLASLLSLTR